MADHFDIDEDEEDDRITREERYYIYSYFCNNMEVLKQNVIVDSGVPEN